MTSYVPPLDINFELQHCLDFIEALLGPRST